MKYRIIGVALFLESTERGCMHTSRYVRSNSTRVLAPTLPTFVYRFYSHLREERWKGRFRDIPAFQGFVAYQVRLITGTIARCKGYKLDDPLIVAQSNLNLRESDFFDLEHLLNQLVSSNLLPLELKGAVLDELESVRERLFDVEIA